MTAAATSSVNGQSENTVSVPGGITGLTIDPTAVTRNNHKESAEAAALKRAEENDRLNEKPLIFGRHKTLEEAESTYKEQQATITRLQQELAAGKKGKKTEAPAAPQSPQEAPKSSEGTNPPKNSQLSQEALSQYIGEYLQNESLSEDSYKALTSMGLGKDIVDSYMAGQAAIYQRNVDKVLAPVGSMDEYKKLIEWASRNLDDGSKAEFDSAVKDITDPKAAAAVKKLKATYDMAAGKFPQDAIEADTNAPGNSAADGYQSYEEMARDMQDPRYSGIGGRKDPAFIRKVQDKVSRSRAI